MQRKRWKQRHTDSRQNILPEEGTEKMNTKERIVETAIRLFNEQGTGAISTNHIAQALSMSPGNLYYHFRNKEEIIRAILERMMTRWEKLYAAPPRARASTVADVEQVVTENFLLLWEYRFFYRELSALVQRDPVLRERYKHIRQERLVNLETLLRQLGNAPSLRASASVTNLARLCWLISDYWLPFLEIEGELILSEVIEQGMALYMQVLRPYMDDTETAQAEPASETHSLP